MVIDQRCFFNKFIEVYSISLEIARKIFGLDENGNFISKKFSNSNHRVTSFEGFHFKMDGMPTLTPGLEFAIYSFYSLLFGEQIINPSFFIVLKGKNIMNDPNQELPLYKFQVSKTVDGENFDEWLKKNSNETLQLEENNFSSLFIGNILTNPSDNKADNFILKTLDEKHFLVGIDNDMAFSYPILKISSFNHQHHLGVKTFLYFFTDWLNKPISNFIFDLFNKLEPFNFISLWLNILKKQNQKYLQMLEKETLIELQLPLILKEGIVTDIYNTLKQCKKILGDNNLLRNITYGDLLQKIQPLIFYVYQNINQQFPTIKERISAIYSRENILENYLNLNKHLYSTFQNKYKRIYQILREYNYYFIDCQGNSNSLSTQKVNDNQWIDEEILNLLETIDITENIDITISIFDFIGLYLIEEEFIETILKKIKNEAWHNKDNFKKLFNHPKCSKNVVKLFIKLGLSNDLFESDKGTIILLNILEKLGENIEKSTMEDIIKKENINLNELDFQGKTILDIIMEKNWVNVVINLIKMGAYIVDWKIAIKFFEKNKNEYNIKSAFKILFKNNRFIAWKVVLHDLFPPIQNHEQKSMKIVKIPFMDIRERIITQYIWNKVFDQKGNIKKTNKTGRANVVCLPWEYCEEFIYLKFYPELPGFEFLISSLLQEITKGNGAPYVQLVNFSGLPCLISQGIQGNTLEEEVKCGSSKLKNLDLESFFRLIIGTIIVAPEDGKPDNYIVAPLLNEENKYQIYSIDNDHALAEPLTKEIKFQVKCTPQIKSILYCFDQMNIPFTENIKNEILDMKFYLIFQKILFDADLQQREYNLIFSVEEATNFFTKKQCFIGIPLKTNMIAKAFDRSIRIQQFFQNYKENNSLPTPFMLLNFVEPILAKRYNFQELKSMSILERFKKIDGKYFESSSETHMTTTSLDAMLYSLGIDINKIPKKTKIIEEVINQRGIGPKQALEELKIQYENSFNLIKLPNSKEEGTLLEKFEKIQLDEYRKAFLENLPPLVTTFQEKFLKKIMKTNCRLLYFRPFASSLKDHYLVNNKNLNNVTWLDMENCKHLTNEIITILSQSCSALTFLNLSKTNLTGFYKLEKFLLSHKKVPAFFLNLRILKLNDCNKLQIIRLNTPELLELHLVNATILIECNGEKNKLTFLDLTGASLFSDKSLDECIQNSSQLKILKIENCPNISFKQFREKFVNKFTTDFYHFFSQFLPNIFEKLLEDNSFFNELNLSNINIPYNSMKYLSDFLKYNQSLKEINFNKNNLDLLGIKYLAESLKYNSYLTKINLCHNNIDSEGIKYLSESLKYNSYLTKINLWNNNFDVEGVKSLFNNLQFNKSILSLYIGNNHIDLEGLECISEYLKSTTSLTILDLGYNNIDLPGITTLANSLKENKSLKIIYLGNNNIDDRGMKNLAKSLKLNSSLTTLHLGNNQWNSEGTFYLTDLLKCNKYITEIYLSFKTIDQQEINYFFELFQSNIVLSKFNIKIHYLDINNFKQFFEIFRNTFLIKLNLQVGNMDNNGIIFLSESLKKNTNLQELILKSNKISSSGMKYLSESLQLTTSLQILNLQHNNIKNNGIIFLSNLLKNNLSLKKLDLSFNQINSTGMDIFLNALQFNKSIVELNIIGNEISSGILQNINELINKNKEINFSNIKVNEDDESIMEDETSEGNIDFEQSELETLTVLEEFDNSNNDIDYFKGSINNENIITNSNCNAKKEFLYTGLSIDGGGFRGYIPVLILEKMQKIIGEKQDLFQYFDYIGGSSIGGILSLGLTIPDEFDDTITKYKIHNLIEIFTKYKNSIFSKKYMLKQFSLDNFLKQFFGEKTLLSSALTPLLITSCIEYSKNEKKGFFFSSLQAQKDEADDYKMWEVARCTFSPTLSKYQIKNIHNQIHNPKVNFHQMIPKRLYLTNDSYLLDGAIWLNNPSELILQSLKEDYKINNEDCLLISLGTGELFYDIPLNKKVDKTLVLESIIQENMKHVDDYLYKQINKNYIRIQPKLEENILLDDISEESQQKMKILTKNFDEKIENITRQLIENYFNRSKYKL